MVNKNSTVLIVREGTWNLKAFRLPDLEVLTKLSASYSGTFKFSPDGTMLASESHSISLWRVPEMALIAPQIFEDTRKNKAVFISPNGKYLAGITTKGVLSLWDLSARKQLKDLEFSERDL